MAHICYQFPTTVKIQQQTWKSDTNIATILRRKVSWRSSDVYHLPLLSSQQNMVKGSSFKLLSNDLSGPLQNRSLGYWLLYSALCIHTDKYIYTHSANLDTDLVVLSPLNTPIWQLQELYKKWMIFPKLLNLSRDFLYLTPAIIINTQLHQHIRYLNWEWHCIVSGTYQTSNSWNLQQNSEHDWWTVPKKKFVQ